MSTLLGQCGEANGKFRVRDVYRLIFVDDEDIVREGITSRVPWGQNGFELTGVFDNGQSALNFLEDNPVDVVLSDISMPRMNGLTLSQKIAARYPKIQVLLLTGFEEFEYAQEAVLHRVKEFLLKPITAEELGKVLERTRSELDKLRDAEREQKRLEELLEKSLPLLREKFFYRLVSGRINLDDVQRRLDFFDWTDLSEEYLVLIAALPDDWEELTRLALSEEARRLVSNADAVFNNRNEDLVILLQGPNEDKLKERADKIGKSLFKAALHLGDSPVSIGIGEVVKRLGDVGRSYIGAGNAVDHTRVLGLTRIQSIEEVRRKSRVSQEAFIPRAQRLITALREEGSHSSRHALDDVFQLFEESFLSSSDVVNYLARLSFHLSDFIDEMDLESNGELADLSLTAEPRRFTQLKNARIYFESKINLIEEHIRKRRNDAVHSRIDRAQRIIAHRYMDKNLSLQDLCSELYLSSSQFSALFKDGTGQTFVEYLTAVRIDEAKKLLKTTDMRSYEVAHRVGYQDPRYFSSIFKKVTGLTTTEYRKELEA